MRQASEKKGLASTIKKTRLSRQCGGGQQRDEQGHTVEADPDWRCAEVFAVSRKQHPFTVSAADLTQEADNCLLLETLTLDPTLGIGGPELCRVSSAQFGGEGGTGCTLDHWFPKQPHSSLHVPRRGFGRINEGAQAVKNLSGKEPCSAWTAGWTMKGL